MSDCCGLSWQWVVGDFALPIFTNDGKTGKEKALSPFTRRFIADPVYSNQGVTDFYDSYNDIQRFNADSDKRNNNVDKGMPTEGKEAEKRAADIAEQIKELSNQVNEIQKSNIPLS